MRPRSRMTKAIDYAMLALACLMLAAAVVCPIADLCLTLARRFAHNPEPEQPMNAIKGFFDKYHAVPATDAGPDYARATTAALDGQLRTMVDACNADEDRSKGAFQGLRKDMAEIAAILIRRDDTTFYRTELARIKEICTEPADRLCHLCGKPMGDEPDPNGAGVHHKCAEEENATNW